MLLILWCGCYATFCLSFCYSPCGGSVLLPDWVSGEGEGSGWRTTLWGHRLTPRVLVQLLPVIGRGRAPPQSVSWFPAFPRAVSLRSLCSPGIQFVELLLHHIRHMDH